MPRPRILQSARRLLDENERRHARALAASEQRLRDSEAKLVELENYRADYLRDFDRRAGGGMAAAKACGYQAFLARIAEAVREQTEFVARARTELAEELRRWRSAARRSAALGRIVEHHRQSEQRRSARGEQAGADENAQRRWTVKGDRDAR